VIEVKHPSVTAHEVHAKAMLTLCGDGVIAFWAVDPETQTVTVYTREGVQRYAASESIPIEFLNCSVCLAEIL
jgi:Uma2 family endonuclease